jgi:FMN reductase (NADPH)/FMN reductase [NAD(P)H]
MEALMNHTLELIHNRKSVRAYAKKEVSREVRDQILLAAMRAPTAGNMQLYSIIEVTDQAIKDRLVETCDNQPFIARAPYVLLFLADYQRWFDYFHASGIEQECNQKGIAMRSPQEGDLFLACCDALIAAQTAVLAAESLGLGSCYIGDIMENFEIHKELFALPRYVFPICLLCIGYPTQGQIDREKTSRFDSNFIVFENQYKRFEPSDLKTMYSQRHVEMFKDRDEIEGARNVGQRMYWRKFDSDFSREMSRSARAMLDAWVGPQ